MVRRPSFKFFRTRPIYHIGLKTSNKVYKKAEISLKQTKTKGKFEKTMNRGTVQENYYPPGCQSLTNLSWLIRSSKILKIFLIVDLRKSTCISGSVCGILSLHSAVAGINLSLATTQLNPYPRRPKKPIDSQRHGPRMTSLIPLDQ